MNEPMCPESLVLPILLTIVVSSVSGLILGFILGRNIPSEGNKDDAPPSS